MVWYAQASWVVKGVDGKQSTKDNESMSKQMEFVTVAGWLELARYEAWLRWAAVLNGGGL